MAKIVRFILLAIVLVSTVGCGTKELVGLGGPDRTIYNGPKYPATSQVTTAFQMSQISKSCRVFAEVLVQLPPNVTGKDIENTILNEAGKRGADQVLIGQSRQGDEKKLRFLYYGPAKEYFVSEQRGGWDFGYELWEKQGDWMNVGYKEWGNPEVRYDVPMVMRLAMLHCR